MPVLIPLGRSGRVRRVLELGCGPYSTGLFLDRRCFPRLQQLVSIEDNADWHHSVLSKLGADSRLDLRLAPDGAAVAAKTLDISAFDLVFIDDSKTGAERVRSIECVMSKLCPGTTVLIHDFEFQPYQDAVSRSLPQTHTVVEIDAINPSCGLIVDNKWTSRLAAIRIKLRLRALREQPAPSDIEAWIRQFQ